MFRQLLGVRQCSVPTHPDTALMPFRPDSWTKSKCHCPWLYILLLSLLHSPSPPLPHTDTKSYTLPSFSVFRKPLPDSHVSF